MPLRANLLRLESSIQKHAGSRGTISLGGGGEDQVPPPTHWKLNFDKIWRKKICPNNLLNIFCRIHIYTHISTHFTNLGLILRQSMKFYLLIQFITNFGQRGLEWWTMQYYIISWRKIYDYIWKFINFEQEGDRATLKFQNLHLLSVFD